MGVTITEEIINSWEKFGRENVLFVMERIKSRKDIENPIGYITAVLKASKEKTASKMASDSKDELILPYLISYFRKSKEPMSNWFIAEKAIEKLQIHYSMELDEATSKFEEIKEELFHILGIANFPGMKSEEEKTQQKIEIENLLKQLKPTRTSV
jgi:hypothetical protein